MTERHPDDDDDDRAAGRRSQTRPVSDPASARPAGVWGQTIALGAAVPPPDDRRPPQPGGESERAVVVVAPVQAAGVQGKPGVVHSTPPPTPPHKGGMTHKQPPPPRPLDTERPPADLAASAAAEPLRVPSTRPAPTPYKSAQRVVPKGTLLMGAATGDSQPAAKAATPPAAARPPAGQTIPLGSDGKITPAAAQHSPPPPAPTPAPGPASGAPGATRQLRPGAARPRADLELPQATPPTADMSFAATMPSVPPDALPPKETPVPPRTPAPTPSSPAPSSPAQSAKPRAAQSAGRQEIRLQLAAADVVQGAPSSMPAGVPRQSPLLWIAGAVVLVLAVVIGWLAFRTPSEKAVGPAATPAAETPVAPAPPVAPVAPEGPSAATAGAPAKAEPAVKQPEPAAKVEPAKVEPEEAPVAKKAEPAPSKKKKKSGGSGSNDLSSTLKELDKDPVLKVKPAEEPEDEGVIRLSPADAPPLPPPMPGE